MRLFAEPAIRWRFLVAVGVYAAVTIAVFVCAPAAVRHGHTPYNHFALLAQGFLNGRLDLGGAPPVYTGGNDFALYDGRYYVVFPPLPAVLLIPAVALAGSAEEVSDGQFFLWLAGLGPAILFVALEKLSRLGQSQRSLRENAVLALLFAVGSVYFFCAVQGSVWFVAHVVAAALAALYLLFALNAERPFLAGLTLGLGCATRSPLLLAAPLFVFEALRMSAAREISLLHDPQTYCRRLAWGRLTRTLVWFAVPVAAAMSLLLAYNAARFGDAFEPGYRYLNFAWRARVETWGLFSYHYLAKNLGVALTSLPWVPGVNGSPFTINYHGLAVWVTTPLYVLLLWPRRRASVQAALWAATIGAALPSLFYQNTGWLQFGYRFSNDYAVFLFALLAVSGWSLRGGVAWLAAWCVVVNVFGAISFSRAEYARFYFADPTQRIIYQPD